MTVAGAGSQTLTAANSYSGATPPIDTGATLQLGDGTSGHDGSIDSTSAINDAGMLIFDRFGNLSTGVVVSGTGDVTVSGGGSETLTGVNTYSGATAINTGATLQLGNGTTGNDGTIENTSSLTDNGTLIFNRFGNISSGVGIGGSGAVMDIQRGITASSRLPAPIAVSPPSTLVRRCNSVTAPSATTAPSIAAAVSPMQAR